MPDTFRMTLNDRSAASRQFVASSPPMASQMTAFATGTGRYVVQAAMSALIMVMVVANRWDRLPSENNIGLSDHSRNRA
jgi:hypothetical protein